MSKHYINDRAWVRAWKDYISRYPGGRGPSVTVCNQHRQRRPSCFACWDTGLCPECMGEHPQYCPAPECGGYCSCSAGTAHRKAYEQSLIDFGL